MANNDKPTPPALADLLGPRIPIHRLRFASYVWMPGMDYGQALTAEKAPQPNAARWELDYLPRVDLVEVRFFAPSTDKPLVAWAKEWASLEPFPA